MGTWLSPLARPLPVDDDTDSPSPRRSRPNETRAPARRREAPAQAGCEPHGAALLSCFCVVTFVLLAIHHLAQCLSLTGTVPPSSLSLEVV